MAIHCLHHGAYLQCTTWLVEGPEGLVLIDPGSGCEDAALLDGLAALGLTADRVAAVLITHCHCDHALGAGGWQARGARLVASEPCATYLAAAHPFIWGEHPELIPPITVDWTLADDETVRAGGLEIRGLLTPGHTPGSMTYRVEADGRQVGFSGDLLQADSTPGWAGEGQYDREALLRSLERLREQRLQRVYPGHGEPIDAVDNWLARGLASGHAGAWHPVTAWQADAVPAALQPKRGQEPFSARKGS